MYTEEELRNFVKEGWNREKVGFITQGLKQLKAVPGMLSTSFKHLKGTGLNNLQAASGIGKEMLSNVGSGALNPALKTLGVGAGIAGTGAAAGYGLGRAGGIQKGQQMEQQKMGPINKFFRRF